MSRKNIEHAIAFDIEEIENLGIDKFAENRAHDIKIMLDYFRQLYEVKYKISPHLTTDEFKISYAYYSTCYKYFKPLVSDKINRFKMASLMELTIIKLQIFSCPDRDVSFQRKLNALLGLIASISIINGMIYHHKDLGFYPNTNNASINDYILRVLKNHELWLETKDLNDFSVIINSEFHELLSVVSGASYEVH